MVIQRVSAVSKLRDALKQFSRMRDINQRAEREHIG
jgi:hypothetical protein